MDELLAARSARFGLLLEVWNGVTGPAALDGLIASDYLGHMLHLAAAERTAAQYADWIHVYRETNPGSRFVVEDQAASGDRLWSRLRATHGDGRHAFGMNVSRFDGDRIAEEWAVWSGWQA